MSTPKRLVDCFDSVIEALDSCFKWLPPGTGHLKVHGGDVEFTYNSIPGDRFQVECGTRYTIVSFLTGRTRAPDRLVSLQTEIDGKIWVLDLAGLLRRDPLLRPDHSPNYPVLTQQWDATGHWTEVKIELSDAEYVSWTSSGQHATVDRRGAHQPDHVGRGAHFPDQVSRAADHIREIINTKNQEYKLRGLIYASDDAAARMELDLHNYAHIDPDATAELIVNASLILPFCEAVRLHHQK
jgi:hypothetical protein